MALKPSHHHHRTTTVTLLTIILLTTHIHRTSAVPSLTQLRTLLSLSHSLFSRVAHLRSSRGDLPGARRAQLVADKLELGLGLRAWPTVLSMGWDYLVNYAWRDTLSFRDAIAFAGDFNELMSSLTELTRFRNDSERVAWVAGNYRNVLRVSKKLFGRLLSVFTKSGPLRELVETLQTEMEGDFLKDCLEVGSSDLKGMVQILKDLASQYTTSDPKQEL
ncbi:hypothetical protein RND81_07G158500 [Saponaria officinalis]|uniref:Uncharacterized protein n=1 Tax=Saponaria officinalis TaxID=3572 RepID=A0AAW1JUT9_SAPOF